MHPVLPYPHPDPFTINGSYLIDSAASSSEAIVYLAQNGNSDANWLAICQQFTDFCQRISGAVVASFIAVALLLFLLVLSALALWKH
ncbi:hypothetical protein ACS0TY_007481 [Phlomoides rotata]